MIRECYKSYYFNLKEYVTESMYNTFGEDSYWFLNENLLKTDDTLREYFGVPVIINNWHIGGPREFSGVRPPSCSFGAQYSQHKFGNASDKIFKGLDPLEVQQEIITHPLSFPYITAIEVGVGWVHTDVRPYEGHAIMQFDAYGKRI